MAVYKFKPTKQVSLQLPTVGRPLISPYVVTRIGGDQFKGSLGDRVEVVTPQLKAKAREYTWRTRTAPIVFDDIFGGSKTSFKLGTHIYSATKLTDEHITMDDVEYARDVAQPQAVALAEDYEKRIVSLLRTGIHPKFDFREDSEAGAFNDGIDPFLLSVELNRLMDQAKRVPQSGRVLLVGTDIAAQFVASKRLSDYSSTGETGTPALRDATIGRLAGVPVVIHTELKPTEGYLIHPTSLGVASIAPDVPRGVAAGAKGSQNGYGIRHIVDYDPNFLSDRAITSSFLGTFEFRDEANPDGSFIFEEDDVPDDDFLAQLYPEGERPTVKANGTRKNIRIIPFELKTGGSVLPEGALGDTTP